MRQRFALSLLVLLSSFLIGFAVSACGTPELHAVSGEDFAFGKDLEAQSREFMALYEEIKLTPEQEAIKKAALEQLPAPCCSDNTAYTCCCPCNLSLTVWGMSAHLIANLGYDAEQVKTKAEEWFALTTQGSHTGDACYTGGCMKGFSNNGCGGMSPHQLKT